LTLPSGAVGFRRPAGHVLSLSSDSAIVDPHCR